MNELLELRIKWDITQAEMAAELGVTQASVSRWENGVIETPTNILMLIKYMDKHRKKAA